MSDVVRLTPETPVISEDVPHLLFIAQLGQGLAGLNDTSVEHLHAIEQIKEVLTSGILILASKLQQINDYGRE